MTNKTKIILALTGSVLSALLISGGLYWLLGIALSIPRLIINYSSEGFSTLTRYTNAIESYKLELSLSIGLLFNSILCIKVIDFLIKIEEKNKIH